MEIDGWAYSKTALGSKTAHTWTREWPGPYGGAQASVAIVEWVGGEFGEFIYNLKSMRMTRCEGHGHIPLRAGATRSLAKDLCAAMEFGMTRSDK